MSGVIYDWGQPPRALFEQLAHEAVGYVHAPPGGPAPLSSYFRRALDRLCEAARPHRPLAAIDAEIGALSRQLETLPLPIDVAEAARLRVRIVECCRERSAEDLAREQAAAGELAGEPCAGCASLQTLIGSIYHRTITGSDDRRTVQGIRELTAPGSSGQRRRPEGS